MQEYKKQVSCCNQRKFLQRRTKAVYLSLTDIPPAHPDTVTVAMTKAQRIHHETGQNFTVFTADQQLNNVALQIVCISKSISKSYS